VAVYSLCAILPVAFIPACRQDTSKRSTNHLVFNKPRNRQSRGHREAGPFGHFFVALEWSVGWKTR
jgi:hypothetical protein